MCTLSWLVELRIPGSGRPVHCLLLLEFYMKPLFEVLLIAAPSCGTQRGVHADLLNPAGAAGC
jgi:hypothetical protein